eukprot:Clim_evm3s98 gene=Clim_evmTU3s98
MKAVRCVKAPEALSLEEPKQNDSKQGIEMTGFTDPYGRSIMADILEDPERPEIKTYSIRWVMLALFSLQCAINGIMWITFSPISTYAQAFFGVDDIEINSLSIVYMAAYVPFSLVSIWVFQKYGPRVGVNIAGVGNFLAALVRFLAISNNDEPRSNGFVILLIGQSIASVIQPLLTNYPAGFAALWFPLKERALATAIASQAQLVGVAVGTYYPILFLNSDTDTVRFFDMLLGQMIMAGVVTVITLCFFREKPPLPPSVSESIKTEKMPIWEEIKSICTNRDFIMLFFSFGIALGWFNGILTIVEPLINTAGYGSHHAGLFSMLFLVVGIVAALLVGIVLDKTHLYNPFLKGFTLASALVVIAFLLAIRPGMSGLLAFLCAAQGAFIVPLMPIAFEAGVECSFPISEDVSTGLLMSSAQLFGIIFIFVLTALVEAQPDYGTTYVFEPTYIVVTVWMVAMLLLIVFYRGRYLRLEAEQLELTNGTVSNDTESVSTVSAGEGDVEDANRDNKQKENPQQDNSSYISQAMLESYP